MKIAVMQPYLFPYIGYFQLIASVDKFVVYDDVNFIKKGWINRNNILLNGQAFRFTFPLKGMSQNKTINQIQIDDNQDWKTDFLKTIRHAYSKAPFFELVFPLVESVFASKALTLSSLNTDSIKKICCFLSIETEIIISSDINKDNSLKGQDKIIEICKILHATAYTNALGGMDLYDPETFREHHIELNFLKPGRLDYTQNKNIFVPNLSIIDVLMFNSAEEVKQMLRNFQLI